jgi:hypothetical protein
MITLMILLSGAYYESFTHFKDRGRVVDEKCIEHFKQKTALNKIFRFRKFSVSAGSSKRPCEEAGGEGGIRTLDTLLAYTHFPGVLFRPLRHFSGNWIAKVK